MFFGANFLFYIILYTNTAAKIINIKNKKESCVFDNIPTLIISIKTERSMTKNCIKIN